MITKLNEAMKALAANEATMAQLAEIQKWAMGGDFNRGQLKAAARRVGLDGAAIIKDIKDQVKN